MTVYEIPLTPTPQTFSVSLSGTVYKMAVNWNQFGEYWVLDISDAQSNQLICGLPMVPGYDLLGQFAYLNILGSLFVQSDFDPDAPPTYDNLGLTSHLYYGLSV